MAIKHIWAYLNPLVTYIQTKAPIVTIFTANNIMAWKPVVVPASNPYLYFLMLTNSELIGNDRNGTVYKKALFEFYIMANNKAIPDQRLYTWLDVISNNLVTSHNEDNTPIMLDTLVLKSIEEWPQSWVLKEIDEMPYIIAQYILTYKSLY